MPSSPRAPSHSPRAPQPSLRQTPRPSVDAVQPLGWARPKGYANAIAVEGSRLLFVAGQVGWDPRSATPSFPATFAEQFDRALANVAEVVRQAGGHPSQLARVTLYVVDKQEYLAAIKEVGRSWKRHVGGHYPAMALVQVSALLEDAARVEIEATAVL